MTLSITNILGLLRLPDKVQDMVTSKQISMGHARILSKLDSEDEIKNLANKIMEEKLSVRDIEKISQEPNLERKNKITKKKEVNENYKYVEDLMQEKLDTKVKIADKKIEISFVNDADLNRILEVLDIKE